MRLVLAKVQRSLQASLSRSYPFEEVDSSGDVRAASRQVPLVLASQVARFFLFVGSAYVMTRLVPAHEFGRLLMVGVPVAAVGLLGDLGLGDGVVRCRDLDPRLASFFFWTNVVVGLGSAICLIALTPLFEVWFDGVELLDLSIAFALVTVLSSLVSQYRALLRRQLRLGTLSLGEVLVTTSSAGASIAAASAGVGAASVPIGRGVGLVVDLALLVHLTGWIPGRVASIARARPVLSFGWKLAFSGVFHFGMTAATTFILGRNFSSETMGFVERSQELSRGFVGRFGLVVNRLTFPLLARRTQSDPSGGTRLASRLIEAGLLAWVVPCLLVAGLAPALVDLALGSEWSGLGSFLAWSWLALAYWLPLSFAVSMLLARGYSGLLVKTNACIFFLQIATAFIGVWFGIQAYMAAAGFAGFVIGLVQLCVLGRRCGADWRRWLGRSAMVACVGLVLAAILLGEVHPRFGPWATLAVGAFLMCSWLLGISLASVEIRRIASALVGAMTRAA